jgi:hypothetical protein
VRVWLPLAPDCAARRRMMGPRAGWEMMDHCTVRESGAGLRGVEPCHKAAKSGESELPALGGERPCACNHLARKGESSLGASSTYRGGAVAARTPAFRSPGRSDCQPRCVAPFATS